jgi:hypothetical protein
MEGKEYKKLREQNKIKRTKLETSFFSADFIKYAEKKNKQIPEILVLKLKEMLC